MTTQTTQTPQKVRTITLTDERPIRIIESAWPVIAQGDTPKEYDRELECQANRLWSTDIRVRRHADGRMIVYGRTEYESHWANESDVSERAGYLLDAAHEGELVVTILRVADDLVERGAHDPEQVRREARTCVANLPAREVDG